MSTNNDYRVSFFKPTNDHSKANRNLVLYLVIIWAVAVFGFHFLLKAVEKPTPEPALTEYLQVKDAVLSGNASLEQKQVFIKSLTSVLAKPFLRDLGLNKVNKVNYPLLKNTLGWAMYDLIPQENKQNFKTTANNFLEAQNEQEVLLTNQNTPGKMIQQKTFENQLAELEKKVGLTKQLLITEMNPYINTIITDKEFDYARKSVVYNQLSIQNLESLPANYIQQLDGIMSFYLTHNRSFLTDTTFLGFPFHYFYSAVFLLILFVVLCWVYAYRTEQINKSFGVVD